MSEVLLHTKLRELEEELKVEREVRIKFEKDLAGLKLDYADLDAQFDEANSAKEREVEASKRLRQEIADLKQKIDHQHNENEESAALLRRKHQESITELSNHIELLSKSKLKFEKENKQFLHQIDELRGENDNLIKIKANALATSRDLENKQVESAQRIDDLLRQLSEVNDLKNKMAVQNNEFYRKNESLNLELQQLSASYKRLNQELDDARMQLENEILVRNNFETKNRNLQFDLDSANGLLEEETESKIELQKQISRLQDEFKANKEKYEKECEAKLDEAEDSKRRLNNRFLELQDQYNDLSAKYSNIDKIKMRLQTQVDTLSTDCDKYKKKADDATKREKQLDKEVDDLKNKLSSANAELDAAYQANRNYSSELSKYKNLNDQFSEQLDSVQKDKRRLTDELETTSSQLIEAQSRLTDLERKVKTIDADRQQIQNDLDDSRDALQIEYSRYQGLQSQFEKLKIDSDKRSAEKDDEIDALRASSRRQIESFQSQLEDAEARHKAELSSMKKKFLAEIEDFKLRLDQAKKARNDAENNLKKSQQTNKDLLDKLTEEQHMHDATRDQMTSAEKRASSYRSDLEEAKALYERTDKAKKSLELEYHDLEEKLNESQSALNRAIAERKKYESDAISASDELHEIKFQLKSAEERVRSSNSLLVKKEEELRHEKEINNEFEASKKAFEQQLRDTQARIEEAEEFARREAKRMNSKLEARLVQLETELELEKNKEQDCVKEIRRLEKRNKELMDQVNEEQARLMTITDAYDKIQEKMKKYKGQIEGAEEQVAANVSKCKRLQRELEDAEDRAEAMAKTFYRAGSVSRQQTVQPVDNYDSDCGESDPIITPSTPSYLRSSYLYSKPTSLDDYNPIGTSTRPASASAWRSKYKTLDIDDDEIIAPRYSKYSNSSFYQSKNKSWGGNRNDRARSVASMLDFEPVAPSILVAPNKRNNIYNSRSSVSRIYDDLNDSIGFSSKSTRDRTHKYFDYDFDKTDKKTDKETTPTQDDLE